MLFFTSQPASDDQDDSDFDCENYLQCSPDDLFEPDDCVLTDVNLSDAREDNWCGFDSTRNFASSLASDGDSYPNSPLHEIETDFPCGDLNSLPGSVESVEVKVEPSGGNSPEIVTTGTFSSPKLFTGQSQNVSDIVKSESIPVVQVKQEPGIAASGIFIPRNSTSFHCSQSAQSILKQPTIVIRSTSSQQSGGGSRVLYPKLPAGATTVKLEPGTENGNFSSISPAKFLVSGHATTLHSASHMGKSSSRRMMESHLLSSNKGNSGDFHLTEEEKRTLVSEGYSVPTKLPLSKAEERSLKKIRRKIKNKISAQESRRKKKEYMDSLERKCENIQEEGRMWKSKCEELENQNKSLMEQLSKLQSQVSEFNCVLNANTSADTILSPPISLDIDVD